MQEETIEAQEDIKQPRIVLVGVGSFFVVGLMLGGAIGLLSADHPWFDREPLPLVKIEPKEIRLNEGQYLIGMNWKGDRLWTLTYRKEDNTCHFSPVVEDKTGSDLIVYDCEYIVNQGVIIDSVGLPNLSLPSIAMPPLPNAKPKLQMSPKPILEEDRSPYSLSKHSDAAARLTLEKSKSKAVTLLEIKEEVGEGAKLE